MKLFDVRSLPIQPYGDALSKYDQLAIVRGKEQGQCHRSGNVARQRNHVLERLPAVVKFAVEDVAREFSDVSCDRPFFYRNDEILNQSDPVVYTRPAL